MLYFTLKFRPAINVMTALCNLDLQKYELSPEEWEITEELSGILKVYFGTLVPLYC
jgi:hypothetical protein